MVVFVRKPLRVRRVTRCTDRVVYPLELLGGDSECWEPTSHLARNSGGYAACNPSSHDGENRWHRYVHFHYNPDDDRRLQDLC